MIKLNEDRKIWLFVTIMLVAYLIILIWAILLKFNDEYMVRGVQEVFIFYPLEERFAFGVNQPWFDSPLDNLKDNILNVLVFVPFGALLPSVIKKRRWVCFIIPFALSLSFEVIQLFAPLGALALDDLICNTIGGIIGAAIGLLLVKLRNKAKKVLIAVVGIIFCGVAMFAVINTIINFDLYIIELN